jgi:hypothetical protein
MDTISVATLNVAGLPGDLPPVRQRAVPICHFLEASGIHTVNLQEVWTRGYLETFRTLLPSYPFVGWVRGLAGQPSGGLVTFSRLPLGRTRYTSFQRTRPGTGSTQFRLEMRLRSALHGLLTIELPTVQAILANTHLVANLDGDWSAGNRHHHLQRAQIAHLHQTIERARPATTGLAILTGDLNVSSDSPLYPAIVDGGTWRDPFAATDPPTFHAEYLPPGATTCRIDYLLANGDAHPVLDHAPILGDAITLPDGRSTHPSDHVGLQATIALTTSP